MSDCCVLSVFFLASLVVVPGQLVFWFVRPSLIGHLSSGVQRVFLPGILDQGSHRWAGGQVGEGREDVTRDEGPTGPWFFHDERRMPEMVRLFAARARAHARERFHILFLKGCFDGAEDPSLKEKRKMNVVKKEDILFELVCGPIKKRLEELGLAGRRGVGVCALLKSSLPRSLLNAILQECHADMSPSFQWGDDSGLPCIAAGSNPAQLCVGSFDGGVGKEGSPVRITLEPGETIVSNGLARNRGVWYSSHNLRFFVSFVVEAAVARAEKNKLDAETNELEKETYSEQGWIDCEEWQGKFEGVGQ